MIFYVYEYWDLSRNIPIYVGKGKNNRKNEHINEVLRGQDKNPNKLFLNYLRKMLKEERRLEIKVIFETSDEEMSFDIEKRLIKKYGRRILDEGPLLNISEGGRGGDTVSMLSDEKKEEIRNKRDLWLRSLNKEEKEELTKKTTKGLMEWRKTVSNSTLITLYKRRANSLKQFWNEKDDDFRRIHSEKTSAALKGKPKSAEHKKKMQKSHDDWWELLSEEERKDQNIKISESLKCWWLCVSPEGKKYTVKGLGEIRQQFSLSSSGISIAAKTGKKYKNWTFKKL